MRRFSWAAVISVAFLAACSNGDLLAPVPAASKVTSNVLLGFNADVPVRISEFHYDNANGDVNEWIEISAPGGTNLQGYTIALYDGTNGMTYATRFLGSIVNASCNGRGVVIHMVTNPPGLHNGPAGMALVRPDNSVVEFFSYEGSFTAIDGPAAGMTSVDIGVSEPGTGPTNPVTSLQRDGASPFWKGPIQNTFGSCNDQTEPPPAASVEVTPSSATLLVGATQQFTAVAYNASHQPIVNATITWVTSDPSIATVSTSGLATAVRAGDVLIIASSSGQADTANVHIDLESVEVTPSSATIVVGATQQFTAVAYGAAHQPVVNAVITWSSSDPSIAAVSQSGLVAGVGAGDVLIIASSSGKADTASVHVDVDNSPPTAALDGPYSGLEGSSVSMSGATSSDPDEGDVLSFAWDFGDGHTGTGANVSHLYTQDGTYNVTLTVTDSDGLVSSATSTANIANVAPSISAFAGATLLPGETYSANGSFSDPGADTWTATVNYGDGSGVLALPLSGKTFSLNHVYANAGVFTVTVRVMDDDATSTRTRTVTVLSPGQGIDNLLAMLQQLVDDGKISLSNSNPIREALENARGKLADGRNDLAAQQLESAIKHLDAAVAVGKISSADALPLRNEILRLLYSLAPDYVMWSSSAQTPKNKGKKGGG